MQTIELPRSIQPLPSSIRKIAIIDDDEQALEVISLQIEDMKGFEPVPIDRSDEYYSDVNKLASYIASKNVYGVICDLRLQTYNFAEFYGSELVSILYDRGIPSILIAQDFSTDFNVSIRKFRDKIPVLIKREHISDSEVVRGIEYCLSEINGAFSSSRKSYNTLVRIESMSNEDGESVVDAIIPSWHYDTVVRFPKSIIPEYLHERLRIGDRLFADVNIGAEAYDQIYLKNFEIAPDPRGIDINDLTT
jgi:hypothetical protein